MAARLNYASRLADISNFIFSETTCVLDMLHIVIYMTVYKVSVFVDLVRVIYLTVYKVSVFVDLVRVIYMTVYKVSVFVDLAEV